MSNDVLGKGEVQAYISYLQDIINRMAANSSNCKSWLIAIIAALFTIEASKDGGLKNIWICYIPTVLFMLLDSYYLGLERQFRDIQKEFVQVAAKEEGYEEKLYNFEGCTRCEAFRNTFRAMPSFSIFPFYVIILIVITSFLIGHFFVGSDKNAVSQGTNSHIKAIEPNTRAICFPWNDTIIKIGTTGGNNPNVKASNQSDDKAICFEISNDNGKDSVGGINGQINDCTNIYHNYYYKFNMPYFENNQSDVTKPRDEKSSSVRLKSNGVGLIDLIA